MNFKSYLKEWYRTRDNVRASNSFDRTLVNGPRYYYDMLTCNFDFGVITLICLDTIQKGLSDTEWYL